MVSSFEKKVLTNNYSHILFFILCVVCECVYVRAPHKILLLPTQNEQEIADLTNQHAEVMERESHCLLSEMGMRKDKEAEEGGYRKIVYIGNCLVVHTSD